MDNGFIKIHRNLNEWGWKKDPKMVAFWMHLLVNANWKDGHYMGHKICAGDIVVGRKALSHETGLSEREIRTCIDKLKMTGEVTSKTTNRFTILTIVKWEEYQDKREQATSRASSKRPTSDQQATTIEEGKKERSNNITHIKPEDISEQTWNDFTQHRKAKRATVNQTVIDKMRAEALKVNMTLEQAMIHTISRGWQGFDSKWIQPEEKPKKERRVI